MKTLISTLILIFAALTLNTALASKGEDIYKKHCAVCHMSGVAKAPKVHNQAAWQKRWDTAEAKAKQSDSSLSGDKLKEAAMNVFIATVKKGLNAMPPGGM